MRPWQTQKRLEPASRLLVAGHKVLQRRATRVGRSTTAAWTPRTEQQRAAAEAGSGSDPAAQTDNRHIHSDMWSSSLAGSGRDGGEARGNQSPAWPGSHPVTEPRPEEILPLNPAHLSLGPVCPPAPLWPFQVKFLQAHPARRSRMEGGRVPRREEESHGGRVPPQGRRSLHLWDLWSASGKLSCWINHLSHWGLLSRCQLQVEVGPLGSTKPLREGSPQCCLNCARI